MIFKDRVKENSTSIGTGNFTLAGADVTFSTFNTAYGVGVPFCYTILDQQNGAWEVGIGQLSAATTLVRTTVQAGSNGASHVNFAAGSKAVFSSVNANFLTNVPLVNEPNIFTGRNQFAATIGAWQTETFATTEVLTGSMQAAVLTPTANFTMDSVSGTGAAGEFQVLYREFRQGATPFSITSWNATNFEKVGAAFPVLTATANARDFLTFTRSQNGKWLVSAGLNAS